MEINGQTGRRIILFSLVAMIMPLLAFPAQFGTQLARASLFTIMYELAYYGLIVFLFHRRTSLIKMIEGAGVCLVYRLAVGGVFGLLIAALYDMNVKVSLTLGLSGYLPSILFQMMIAPFILKPVIDSLYPKGAKERRPTPIASPPPDTASAERTSIAGSRKRPAAIPEPTPVQSTVDRTTAFQPVAPPPTQEPVERGTKDMCGFERAVRYIGEHGSVHLAAVVDDEGLLLSSFCRGGIESEDWAPLALLLLEGNRQVLGRADLGSLDKLNLQLAEKRLVIADSEGFCLMVLSERQDDDLLSIRIKQGMNMIKKYVAERYGNRLNSNAETINVPSA